MNESSVSPINDRSQGHVLASKHDLIEYLRKKGKNGIYIYEEAGERQYFTVRGGHVSDDWKYANTVNFVKNAVSATTIGFMVTNFVVAGFLLTTRFMSVRDIVAVCFITLCVRLVLHRQEIKRLRKLEEEYKVGAAKLDSDIHDSRHDQIERTKSELHQLLDRMEKVPDTFSVTAWLEKRFHVTRHSKP
ncbi:MAG: hypothetical protein ACRCYY_20325 [Trueperaceae bacterium]